MKIGVIGLGDTGQEVVARLLRRTCHDLYVYDPDHKACRKSVYYCDTAAEVCGNCGLTGSALFSIPAALLLILHHFPLPRPIKTGMLSGG